MSKMSILVIEDGSSIIDAVRACLKEGSCRIYNATDESQAINLLDKLKPSLIINDSILSEISSDGIYNSIQENIDHTIIESPKCTDDDVLCRPYIRAKEYTQEPLNQEQTVTEAEALTFRTQEEYVSSTRYLSLNNGDIIIDTLSHEVKKNGRKIYLTHGEYRMLLHMIKFPGVYTRSELATTAFGDRHNRDDRVIDSHVKNLRRKIETNPRFPQYILTVYGVGYRFGDVQK